MPLSIQGEPAGGYEQRSITLPSVEDHQHAEQYPLEDPQPQERILAPPPDNYRENGHHREVHTPRNYHQTDGSRNEGMTEKAEHEEENEEAEGDEHDDAQPLPQQGLEFQVSRAGRPSEHRHGGPARAFVRQARRKGRLYLIL